MTNNLIYFAISSNDDYFQDALTNEGYDYWGEEPMTKYFRFKEPAKLLTLPTEELFLSLDEIGSEYELEIEIIGSSTTSMTVVPWFKGNKFKDWKDTQTSEEYLLFTVNKDTLEVKQYDYSK